jgi:hypothetical protein
MSVRLILLRKPDRMRLLDQLLLSHPISYSLRLLFITQLGRATIQVVYVLFPRGSVILPIFQERLARVDDLGFEVARHDYHMTIEFSGPAPDGPSFGFQTELIYDTFYLRFSQEPGVVVSSCS